MERLAAGDAGTRLLADRREIIFLYRLFLLSTPLESCRDRFPFYIKPDSLKTAINIGLPSARSVGTVVQRRTNAFDPVKIAGPRTLPS